MKKSNAIAADDHDSNIVDIASLGPGYLHSVSSSDIIAEVYLDASKGFNTEMQESCFRVSKVCSDHRLANHQVLFNNTNYSFVCQFSVLT